MIRQSTKQPGWYHLDWETATPLYGLPGAHVDGGWFLIHRNLLPVLGLPEAIKLLPADPDRLALWERRDRHTTALGFKLRTTQQQAIDFLTARNGGLLGDEQRLGKTVSSIMSHDPTTGPLFIVAPLPTRGVWLGWLKRIFPEHAQNGIGVITGRKFDWKVLNRPIVFGHYDIIHHWQSIKNIGTLVLDEAHLLTNPNTRRTEAAALLANWSKRVICATGTPIWNMPANLWSVLSLIAPKAFGNYYDFAQRYGAPVPSAHGTKYTGVSHEVELRLRLSEVMIRRRWCDCSEDLPPIVRSVAVSEVSPVERKKLDIMAAKLAAERTNTIGNLAAYRSQVATLKAPTVVAEATKLLGSGEPVVIWTWHREFAKQLYERLGGKGASAVFMIHGDIPADAREEQISKWKTCPVAGALIATMAVAQVGIDLSHARHAIFAEIDYTPAILGQAEMRIFAPTRSMSVTFVVADHIVDQRIVRALVNKLSASDPLGVGAAVDAIDALRDAVMGPVDYGDLDRLLEDLISSGD